jgi:Zn-dependent metalloprotease
MMLAMSRVAACSLALTLIAGSADAQSLSSLQTDALGPLQVTRHPTTGTVNFVRGRIASGVSAEQLATAPEIEALAFLQQHAAALGMPAVADQLVSMDRTVVDELGMTHVRFQQYLDTVPVYGMQVIVHYEAGGTIVSTVNGDFVPALNVSTDPSLRERRAVAIARSIEPGGVLSGMPELVVYTAHVDPAVAGDHLAWLVTLEDLSIPTRKLFVIDAHTGTVLRMREELRQARNRRIFDANGTSTPTLARTEGQGPVGDTDVDNLYDFCGSIYDYFFNNHGLDSYDGNGSDMRAVAHYNGFNPPCPNAFWDGSRLWFCNGLAVDDIAAHELAHGVIQFSANLIYMNQSGAMNESYADIFGELIDIDTVYGDGTANPWLLGEGSSIGALRNMANPPAFGDPDRGSNYLCTSQDNGGVHTNSGIGNKAAYLMAEGGTFNGQTISGIGYDATSAVQYRALSQYLTMSSNYLANYNALNAACADLYGGASGNCTNVDKAGLAVEMNNIATCGGGCPLAATVTGVGADDPGRGAGLLRTMYALRTQLLRGTTYGRRLIKLYYTHASDVKRLVEQDERLRAQFLTLVGRIAEGVESMDAEGADAVRLTPHTAALFAAVLRTLEQAEPGSALSEAIRSERDRLSPSGLVGRTFESAWTEINERAAQ